MEDIAAMKLDAICSRKTKKDYIDIAVLLKHYSFSQLISFYREKFPRYKKESMLRHVLNTRGIENSPTPKMLISLTYEEALHDVKKSFYHYLVEKSDEYERELSAEQFLTVKQLLKNKPLPANEENNSLKPDKMSDKLKDTGKNKNKGKNQGKRA